MVFKQSDQNRFDFELLSFSAVTLFQRLEIFEDAIQSLEALNYRVLRVRCETRDQFVNEMSIALKWGEQFDYSPWSGNLNALGDGLRQEPIESGDDTVICLENFQTVVENDEGWSCGVLDCLVRASHEYLLFGKRLVILVQTSDRHFHCDQLGCSTTCWNSKEWLNSARDA